MLRASGSRHEGLRVGVDVGRLLFVDDHPLYRTGLQLSLARALPRLRVFMAASGEEALALLEAGLDVDLCLADLRLPVMDGFTLQLEVGRRWPAIARALLCADASPELARRARQAGLVGCISKAREAGALAQAVDEMFAGLEVFDAEGPGPLLSEKRLRVLDLAARGQSNKAIAKSLGITERTVKDHWSHIFERLGVANRAEAVSRAHQMRLI